MAHIVADRVRETSVTTGTGTYDLDGAVLGFQDFDAACASADTVWAAVVMGNDWEVGRYTFTAGSPDTLARTAILASTNGGAAVNWGAGTKDIFLVVPASILSTMVASVTTQEFTASGTYTPTAGMVFCIIECIGGGGGGGAMLGGAASQYFWGGGGGAGSYSRHVATAADIGASKAVTIGAGGAGGIAASTNDGQAGGDTSVGTLCIGKGGAGGKHTKNDGTSVGAGGAGGVAGTGNILTGRGAPGSPGLFSNVASVLGAFGAGASSIFGGGAAGNYTASTAVTGSAGGNYGAGGSGGSSPNTANPANGGAGSAGFVVITEFCNR